jgi:hypothetical protein
VGKVKIPYYRVKRAKGFFEPTPEMKRAGFAARPLGDDGPEAWQRAWALYEQWQSWRRGETAPPERTYLIGSIGEAMDRYRRTKAWADKSEGTRREWSYVWTRWLEPRFADIDPATLEVEHLEDLHRDALALSEHAAHKVIKVWRALWRVMAAMRYCETDKDPSLAIRNKQPKGRSEIWREGEVARLAKAAWRSGFHGLAAIIAVIWYTQFSPGDARKLTLAQRRRDKKGLYFDTSRSKTGKAAIGTVGKRGEWAIDAYLATLTFELMDDAPLFRDKDGKPYTMFSLDRDFRAVRAAVFCGDTRRLMDIRRSGAVEAGAGGVDPFALANKMANSIDRSGELQATYVPRRVGIVRLADAARIRGRRALRENE